MTDIEDADAPHHQMQPRSGGKHGHSYPPGVTKKGDRYRARISWRNKTRDLGMFLTVQDAKRAVCEGKAVVFWKNVQSFGVPFHRRLAVWAAIYGVEPKILARRAKIRWDHYRKLENGEHLPSFNVLLRLADTLDIPLDALVGRKHHQQGHTPVYPLPSLPARLTRIRTAAGMTYQDLATRAGVNVKVVKHIERGTRSPSLQLAWRLCQALDCPLDDMVQPVGVPLLRQPARRPKHVRVRKPVEEDYVI